MAASKKQNVSARVRAYQAKHPTASAKQVAEACKTSAAYVYVVRSKDAKWKTAYVGTSNMSINTVIDTVTDMTPTEMEELVFKLTQGRDRPEEPQADNVNHPAHYKVGGIETIDFIEAKLTPEEFRGYLKGNVLKYVSRANSKDCYETDMLKARWYLNRETKRFVEAGNKDAA